MNVYDSLRELINKAERLAGKTQRYQVKLAASGEHGLIHDTHATEWADLLVNAEATGLPVPEAVLTVDRAKIIAALLNLGYPRPVNPAVVEVILAFMPGAETRGAAREGLFDTIQVQVTAMLHKELGDRQQGDPIPDFQELGLQVQGIVERHFAHRPEPS